MGAILSVVGTLVGAASQASQMKAQAQQQAYAMQYNAAMNRQLAEQAINNAQIEERYSRIRSGKQIGSIKAQYGASGVELEGSPFDVLEESSAAAESDAQIIRLRGQQQAQGYLNTAALDEYNARATVASAKKAASSALFLGGLKGITGLVGSGGFGLSRVG